MIHRKSRFSVVPFFTLYFIVSSLATSSNPNFLVSYLSIQLDDRSLEWKVHPPTSFCFCQHIIQLLPSKLLSFEAKHSVLELSRFLTELSVIDYFFVRQRPSVVAYASVLNAMEEVITVSNAVNAFVTEVERNIPHLNINNCDLEECRSRLKFLYTQGSYSRPVNVVTPIAREESVSPVCVSFDCNNQKFIHNSYHTQNGFA
jgi:Cyclin, C-terminal domain